VFGLNYWDDRKKQHQKSIRGMIGKDRTEGKRRIKNAEW
jgi:hypothetical protein